MSSDSEISDSERQFKRQKEDSRIVIFADESPAPYCDPVPSTSGRNSSIASGITSSSTSSRTSSRNSSRTSSRNPSRRSSRTIRSSVRVVVPPPHPAPLPPTRKYPALGNIPYSYRVENLFDASGALRVCPICFEEAKDMRRHAYTVHLPFFLAPQLSCWTCKRSFATRTLLSEHISFKHHGSTSAYFSETHIPKYVGHIFNYVYTIADKLGFPAIDQVAAFATTMSMLPPTPRSGSLMTKVCLSLALSLQTGRNVRPEEINHHNPAFIIDILTSWETILYLLTHVSPRDLATLKTSKKLRSFDGSLTTKEDLKYLLSRYPAYFIDAHTHLESVLHTFQVSTVEDLSSSSLLYAVISNSCFPKSEWPYILAVQPFNTPAVKVYHTIGIHPSVSNKFFSWNTFNNLLLRPDVIGIGECGLDFKSDVKPRVQESILRKQLQKARMFDLPVILHCRPRHDTEEEYEHVYDRTRQLAQEILPRSTKVMLHSYLGTESDAEKWNLVFTNVIYSVSPKALKLSKYPYMEHTLRILHPDQTVLETDSPHQFLHGNPTHPYHVREVAQKLSEITHWPASIILRSSYFITRNFFNI